MSDAVSGFELWAHQRDAVEEIADAWRRGSRVVVLEGPPGSGKTVIAREAIRRAGLRAVYVCTSIALENQVSREFGWPVLHGREHYPTALHPDRWPELSCTNCDHALRRRAWEKAERPAFDPAKPRTWDCGWCMRLDACPYEMAKSRAFAAPVYVTNLWYWLCYARLADRRRLVVIDECDRLESVLMSLAEVRVSKAMRRRVGVDTLPRLKTKPQAWREWLAHDLLPALQRWTSAHDHLPPSRESEAVARLADQVHAAIVSMKRDEPWVGQVADDAVVLKPTTVADWGKAWIWDPAKVADQRILVMSATIISDGVWASSVGLDEYAFVQVRASYPPERRRVVVVPAPAMTARASPDDISFAHRLVARVVAAHPDERVLVHAVSYARAREMAKVLSGRPVRVLTPGRVTEDVDWLRRTPGAVLVSAGLERGIDLPHDDCRVVVIAKVPWGDLSDPLVKARAWRHSGRAWYVVETVRSLIQASGRAMRSADDWCRIYVTDGDFMRLWREWRNLFPRWWAAALDWRTGAEIAREVTNGMRKD